MYLDDPQLPGQAGAAVKVTELRGKVEEVLTGFVLWYPVDSPERAGVARAATDEIMVHVQEFERGERHGDGTTRQQRDARIAELETVLRDADDCTHLISVELIVARKRIAELETQLLGVKDDLRIATGESQVWFDENENAQRHITLLEADLTLTCGRIRLLEGLLRRWVACYAGTWFGPGGLAAETREALGADGLPLYSVHDVCTEGGRGNSVSIEPLTYEQDVSQFYRDEAPDA